MSIWHLVLGSKKKVEDEGLFYKTMTEKYNVLFVAAAGNNGKDASLRYPASYPSVVSVAAVDASSTKVYT